MRLLLIAVTHQRNVATPSHLLKQPQRELLTVILDPLIGSIETNAALEELMTVAPREFRLTNLARPN